MVNKEIFFCTECGTEATKWSGQCNSCQAWNTIQEMRFEKSVKGAYSDRLTALTPAATAITLDQVNITDIERIGSGSAELDRVLGGGLVPGSVILLGGDPGIGKSTLLLQALANIGAWRKALYVSGEESTQQLAISAKRLRLNTQKLRVMAENRLQPTLQIAAKEQTELLVVDSIQTLYSEALAAAPGSVSQVRECGARLVRYAKDSGCTVVLVGHVTREGTIAGPRILEHMVDTVLYFEGDTSSSFRLIRAIKNRFGAINEIGVFAMSGEGLKDVSNPSAMFVNRQGATHPGSVVLASQEGTRPLLVEVQALVDESSLANPRRLCVGLEQNRLAMLLAVLHRHAGIAIGSMDVFANVTGGVRINETGSDLALVLAIVSSVRNRSVGNDLVVFGEIGLSGELRPVQRGLDRLREAAKLGFKRALIPAANKPKQSIKSLDVIAVKKLQQALEVFD